ncbi:MAG TPA: hypothetical protein VGD27_09345 [Longimicrobiales bacterium]
MIRTSVTLALFVTLTACATSHPRKAPSASDTRLVGTWELVSTKITNGPTTLVEGGPPEIRSLKILNATDYSVVTRRADQFLRAGTGRYTLVGNTYTETVDLASGATFIPGGVYTFEITLDGDMWTLDGGSGPQRVHEVWRRIRK